LIYDSKAYHGAHGVHNDDDEGRKVR